MSTEAQAATPSKANGKAPVDAKAAAKAAKAAKAGKPKDTKGGKVASAAKAEAKANGKAKAEKPAKEAKPAKEKAPKKEAKTKAEKPAKEKSAPKEKKKVELDAFGFRKGSKKSEAAKLYSLKKGATLAEVKEKTGSSQLNLLKELEEKGHTVEKEKVAGPGKKQVTRYKIVAAEKVAK